jgi:Protein of unknown function (DUF4238)
MATSKTTAANPMAPETKTQHYIPKFYLKGFADKEGVLWVCEKFKPIRASKPKHEANRPDYYTLAKKDGRDDTAENLLQDIESRAAPIICKLASPHYVLTPENASHLITFVAVMFARVPSWRDNLDNMAVQIAKNMHLRTVADKQTFGKLCEDFERSTGKALGVDHENLRQEILRGDCKYETVPAAGFSLGSMFKSALTILALLEGFGYEALYAPAGKYFVTSDAPVFTLQPDGRGQATIGVGFGRPNVEVYLPLNKRTCLRMKRGLRPQGREIVEGHLNEINRTIIATATRCLYSSERYKRIARLFSERGCKVRPGKESFLPSPPTGHGILF